MPGLEEEYEPLTPEGVLPRDAVYLEGPFSEAATGERKPEESGKTIKREKNPALAGNLSI